MPSIVFDATSEGLGRALTLHQRRHEVLTSNVANVETPGYRANELDFGTALKEAFEVAPPETPFAPTRVVEDRTAPARADGNTVDVDLQMMKLSDNAGRYRSLARILGLRLALVRQAIDGSK